LGISTNWPRCAREKPFRRNPARAIPKRGDRGNRYEESRKPGIQALGTLEGYIINAKYINKTSSPMKKPEGERRKARMVFDRITEWTKWDSENSVILSKSGVGSAIPAGG